MIGEAPEATASGSRRHPSEHAQAQAPHDFDRERARRETYRKIVRYRRLTWTRTAAVGLTVLLWLVFLVELQPAKDSYAEQFRDQLRLPALILAIAVTLWALSVVRRRHTVGEDLYVADALPATSSWPTIVMSLLVAIIGAVTTYLTRRSR